MSKPERGACEALRDYALRDGNLFDLLRTDWIWNDAEFQTLVNISTQCLEEIESDDMIPRHVASFFGHTLHLIKGIMQHPDFLADNRAGRTEQETKAYFAKRHEIIDKLIFWMTQGKRLHPPEHFVLPEWQR